MKKVLMAIVVSAAASVLAGFEANRSVMSEAYWNIWNDEVQARIDADIEKYRKADAEVAVDAPDGTEVKVGDSPRERPILQGIRALCRFRPRLRGEVTEWMCHG